MIIPASRLKIKEEFKLHCDEIMEALKTNHIWTSEVPGLEPCVFCGGNARLIVSHPMYGLSGAWVRCRSCGACGPTASIYAMIVTPDTLSTPLLPESLERGITGAVEAWNSRTVDRSRMGNLRLEAGKATA